MRALLFVVAVLAGCKDSDPNAEVCQHYAKLAVKCQSGDSNGAVLGDTADNVCRKGMSGKHDEIFGARYKAMIDCTRKAESCQEYEKCKSGD